MEYLPWTLLQFQARNLITFLVVDQLISLVSFHQLLLVCIPVIFQLLHQPHCLQMFQVRKPVTRKKFIHYSLQLVFQVCFRIFKLVTSQPMLQVCDQAVQLVMVLIIFQYWILDSTLVYHSQKPHLSLQVPVLVLFSWYFQYSTLLFILNQHTVVFNQWC